MTEQKALYNISGYIIMQLTRFTKCKDCVMSVIAESCDEIYASYTNEKDVNDSLIKVTREFYEFMLDCEVLLRWLQPFLRKHCQNEGTNTAFLLEETLRKYKSKDFLIHFKNCHKFFDKVIKSFSLFRMKTWTTDEKQESQLEKLKIAYGSKSVAMRQLVSKNQTEVTTKKVSKAVNSDTNEIPETKVGTDINSNKTLENQNVAKVLVSSKIQSGNGNKCVKQKPAVNSLASSTNQIKISCKRKIVNQKITLLCKKSKIDDKKTYLSFYYESREEK